MGRSVWIYGAIKGGLIIADTLIPLHFDILHLAG